MAYARPIFETGKAYRAKKTFMSGRWVFRTGEILLFESDAYSRCDNCFVCQFRRKEDGQQKVWFLHEDEPVEEWQEWFESMP